MRKKVIKYLSYAVILVVAAASALSGGLRWDIASAVIAVISCVPFILSFEKSRPSAKEIVITAAMTAFSAAGRLVFAPVPFFKPVSAVVIMCGMYFGKETGAVVGALSAVISAAWFGMGVWVPFQMLSWGFIGFAAGIAGKKGLSQKPVLLCVFGAATGIVFSCIMDVWTVLSADGAFSVGRWAALTVSALPVTAVYAVSNVVFLLILRKPLGKRLERLKTKYGVFGG